MPDIHPPQVFPNQHKGATNRRAFSASPGVAAAVADVVVFDVDPFNEKNVTQNPNWKQLHGKYKKFFAEKKWLAVETFYNTQSIDVRYDFRNLINSIHETSKWAETIQAVRASTKANQLSLTGFQYYVQTWFAESQRKYVVKWLNEATNEQVQLFAHVMTELENAASRIEHRTRTLPELKFPFPTPRQPVLMSKKKPSRRNLDGREPFARLPIFYNNRSVMSEQYQPITQELIQKFKCNTEENDINKIACNPRFTSVMRIIPTLPNMAVEEHEDAHAVADQLIAQHDTIQNCKNAIRAKHSEVKKLQSRLGGPFMEEASRAKHQTTQQAKIQAVTRPFCMKYIM